VNRQEAVGGMNEWPGASGQDQPPDRPIFYPDPAAAQPTAWPGFEQPSPAQPAPEQPGFEQPAPAQPAPEQPGFEQPAPVQPAPQYQPTQSSQFQPLPANDPLMSGEPIMVTIGDISVTSTTVYTPSGSRPLSEVSWAFSDMSITSQNIPTWAIICAIVFFVFCFVGLLFLLAKEEKTQGAVQVTVQGPGFLHTSTIPVSSLAQVADINARVNYVRTLTFPGVGYPAQPGLTGQVPGGQVTGGEFFGGPQGIAGQPWQPNQPGSPGQGFPGQQGFPSQGFPGQQGLPGQPGQQDQQPGQFS
jgi:hypothetical protein